MTDESFRHCEPATHNFTNFLQVLSQVNRVHKVGMEVIEQLLNKMAKWLGELFGRIMYVVTRVTVNVHEMWSPIFQPLLESSF